MSKRLRLLSFALYDSAETVLGALVFSTLYPLYITEHLDTKVYSALYGFSFFLSFLLALQLGRVADSRGLRKRFFIFFSLGVPLMGLVLHLTFEVPTVNFLFYLLLALVHQQALVFYNSLLKSFDARGVASGLGVAVGYVGSAVALLFLAPRVELPQAFIWVSLIFFLLSLPSLLTLKEPQERQQVRLKELLKDRRFLFLMGSILMLMELAHTLIAMMGVYLREVYALDKQEIYRVIGLSALGGVLGGAFFGLLTDRMSAERLFPFGFFLWAGFVVLLYFTPESMLLPLGLLAGLCLSHLWTTSRVLLLEKFTEGDVSVRFSFYSLSERVASTVGLMVWSFFLLVTGGQYRLSALLMLVFPLLGLVLYLLSDRRFKVKGF
ncbi:MAG: MFS transporter [Aquificaceae bacterium]|nr:MFS transporter [Aquificaceae bacterium]MCX8060000.1 MFS transporter [Aquificaceae bacterium]MDW8096840.1 MFS transporter [Aquificaceae bacterium]